MKAILMWATVIGIAYLLWTKVGPGKAASPAPAAAEVSTPKDKTPAANADNRVRSLTGEAPLP